MSFVTPHILGRLGFLSREEADGVNFGIIKVDPLGQIELINRYCCELGGIEAAFAEGRNFFTEIAPCTNNRLFLGKFRDGMQESELDVQFNYTLTYKVRPTHVRIHLLRDPGSGTNWIFMRKAAPQELSSEVRETD